MPEGDTIFRAARRLAHVLAGQPLVGFDLPMHAGRTNAPARVLAVEAVGKYLLVRFDDQRVLVTHMKMTGSWRIFRRGQRWRGGRAQARAVLETAHYVAVCFDAPVVRLMTAAQATRALATLGPDLLAPEPDLALAVKNLRGAPLFTIAEALLAQSLVAGIGNEIKSEALFLAKIDPRAKVKDVSDAALERALVEAVRILRINVAPTMRGPRRSRGGASPTWAYGRAGEPCLVCKTPIARIYQGPFGARRSTYFCPTCVREAAP
jgi:endonuclease VIII